MAAPIGSLTVRIGANLDGLQRGVQQAQGHLGKLGAEMRSSINIAGKYAAAMTAAGAALSVGLVANAGKAALELRNLSKVANTSTDVFQKHAYAAKQFGIEQDKLADIFKDTGEKLGEFMSTGAGPLQDFFTNVAPKIGITADQFRNLSGPQALQMYVDALEQANLSQSEMSFYLEALASDSTKLLPLLQNNASELSRLSTEASKVGAVLSNIQLDSLVEAKQSMDRLAESMKGMSNLAAISLAPALRAIADVLSTDLQESLASSRQDIVDWGQVTGDVIAFAADATNAAVKTIGTGFSAVGHGLGATLAATVAKLKGETELAESIGEDFRSKMSDLFTGFAEDSDFSQFRDRLKEIREETERMSGLSEINITGGQRQMDPRIAGAVKEATEAAAAAAEKVKVEISANEDAEERQREHLSRQLEAVRESMMTEAELETTRHHDKLETLIASREGEIVTEAEYRALREEAEQQHQDRLTAIEQAGLTERQRFERASLQQKVKTVFGELANITAGVSQHNRKMFELNKVAGIANAIINAYEGISLTMKSYPYPLNLGMAAAHAVSAFAQVSAIKSASFGGASAPSIAGSTPATPVTPVTSGAPSQIGGRLAIEGINPDSLFSGHQMRELAERLQEHIRDGGTIVFT